ncbi:alpha-N-acetylgalactosaminidase-like isoform X1 [Littorina saxatilis]|uniref:Alpha-galactosidase n=1 Tax=Littorina saxatilis TaxID=31220 RepID=A0AAN9B1M4_9CAEN
MKVIISLCLFIGAVSALNNGLALTPPMGWLSWERFRCNVDCVNDPHNCISENLILEMADIMVNEGYKDAGYVYVNIDACWMANYTDENGGMVPDPKRFPNGPKYLADKIHAMGMKFGMYQDFGHITCLGYPGAEFHLEQYAYQFASWEIDLLKFDGCNSVPRDGDTGYPVMEFFLNKTGRQILYSCEWPLYQLFKQEYINYTAVAAGCNTWRAYHDIQDSWDSVKETLDFWGNNSGNFASLTGPGSFSDPDMLIVGDFGLSYDQQRVQMGMWAMLSAPMHMSVDLRNIDPKSKALLQNRNVIALNQDPLGYTARRLLVYTAPRNQGIFNVWKKVLYQQGSYALAFVNYSDQGTPNTYTTTLGQLGLTNASGYNVTEIFSGMTVGQFRPQDEFKATVNPEGIYLVKCVTM